MNILDNFDEKNKQLYIITKCGGQCIQSKEFVICVMIVECNVTSFKKIFNKDRCYLHICNVLSDFKQGNIFNQMF